MKVLVTGGSGFVGKNFLRSSPEAWEIVATYRTDDGFPEFLRKWGLQHVTPVHCDLSDPYSTARIFAEHGRAFSHCLYLASNVSIPLSVENPVLDLQLNAVALLNVLENIQCDRFVYMSSGAVYDGHKGVVDVSMPLLPSIPYAISKLACEGYLRFFHRRRRSIADYSILRFFGAYGPYEPSRKIYSKLVQSLALDHRHLFRVTGDGTNLIDAMYISDAIEGIMRVLMTSNTPEVLDFASGSPLCIDELVHFAAKTFHRTVEIEHKGRTEEPIAFRADTEPMKRLFGFEPRIPLDQGLLQLRDHLLMNPN